MMKMITSREDRATMTAMIGMSSDWLLSTSETERKGNIHCLYHALDFNKTKKINEGVSLGCYMLIVDV